MHSGCIAFGSCTQALVEHGPEMRALTTAEAGAPTALTTGPQYDVPVESMAWTIDLAEKYEWTNDLGAAHSRWASPLGDGPAARRLVSSRAITPWNFPNQINLAKVGPALRGGKHGRPQARAGHALGRRRTRPARRAAHRHAAGRVQRRHVESITKPARC